MSAVALSIHNAPKVARAAAVDGFLELATKLLLQIPDERKAVEAWFKAIELQELYCSDEATVSPPRATPFSQCLPIPPNLSKYAPLELKNLIRSAGPYFSPGEIVEVVTVSVAGSPAKAYLLDLLRFYGPHMCSRGNEDAETVADRLAKFLRDQRVQKPLTIGIQHALFGLVGAKKVASLLKGNLIQEVPLGQTIPYDDIKNLVSSPRDFIAACEVLHPELFGIVQKKLAISRRALIEVQNDTFQRAEESAHGLRFAVINNQDISLTNQGNAYLNLPIYKSSRGWKTDHAKVRTAIIDFLETASGHAYSSDEILEGIALNTKRKIDIVAGLKTLQATEASPVRCIRVGNRLCWYHGALREEDRDVLRKRFKSSNKRRSSTITMDAKVAEVLDASPSQLLSVHQIFDKVTLENRKTKFSVLRSLNRLTGAEDSRIHRLKIGKSFYWYVGQAPTEEDQREIKNQNAQKLAAAYTSQELIEGSTLWFVYKHLKGVSGTPLSTKQIASQIEESTVSEHGVRIILGRLKNHSQYPINRIKIGVDSYWYHGNLSTEKYNQLSQISIPSREKTIVTRRGNRSAVVDEAVATVLRDSAPGKLLSLREVVTQTILPKKSDFQIKSSLNRLITDKNKYPEGGKTTIGKSSYWYVGQMPTQDQWDEVRNGKTEKKQATSETGPLRNARSSSALQDAHIVSFATVSIPELRGTIAAIEAGIKKSEYMGAPLSALTPLINHDREDLILRRVLFHLAEEGKIHQVLTTPDQKTYRYIDSSFVGDSVVTGPLSSVLEFRKGDLTFDSPLMGNSAELLRRCNFTTPELTLVTRILKLAHEQSSFGVFSVCTPWRESAHSIVEARCRLLARIGLISREPDRKTEQFFLTEEQERSLSGVIFR